MHDYSLTHLSDAVLLRDLADLARRDRVTTAALLAHIAEVETRKLHVPAGYPSMLEYCVGALGMSEDAALKRIQVARAARRFPVLFGVIAEGGLHLTGVGLLAPHLSDENLDELVSAASNRSKREIEILLARRCGPRPASSGSITVVPGGCDAQHAPAHVNRASPAQVANDDPVAEESLVRPDLEMEPMQPELPERYLIRITVDRGTHERLRYAQALLRHAIPSGDVAQVVDRALVALIQHLERGKFGAGARVRPYKSRSRHIPAHIRRAVWDRDQGQCTFVGSEGHRCRSKSLLEFDHVQPFARVPEASVDGLRLRCRAHNQHEAECAFGSEFMARKRKEARSTRRQEGQDVLAALRGLGIKGEQARRASARAEALQDATLEERIRAALQYHGECVMRNPRAARLLSASG
jgi:hypothetical protein